MLDEKTSPVNDGGGLGDEDGAASIEARLRALELQHLQLRIKYLQVQVQLLKSERGGGAADAGDVEVLEQQIESLRRRILRFGD